jgi:hypothetical protein
MSIDGVGAPPPFAQRNKPNYAMPCAFAEVLVNEDRVIAKLRAACEKAGSQAAWARANGIHAQYVSAVLRGNQHPGPQIVRALGVKLEVSRRYSFTYHKDA